MTTPTPTPYFIGPLSAAYVTAKILNVLILPMSAYLASEYTFRVYIQ